jgi:hypothetical protein
MAAAAATAATVTLPAYAADVGVSLSIGEPGFFGRIDIGGYPPPPVINPQPVVVEAIPGERPPIYLRVPPGHARHWARYCRDYDACGERVYFVQDDWYTREFVPRYRERHRDRRDEGGERHWDEHHREGDHRDYRDYRG